MDVTTHHGFLEDCDFRALPQEVAWEPQWDAAPDFPFDADAIPAPPVVSDDAPPRTLAGRYARMAVEKEDTTLFDVAADANLAALNTTLYGEHEAELCSVLGKTFECIKRKGDTDLRSSKQLITELEDKSNYTVEQVVRTMNKAQYRMHRAVAESYNIRVRKTTYHGTSQATAPLITSTGFKGAACERSMFGKGVYSSPNVWVALGYAEPFDGARQVFFVVDYIQGPHAPGSKEQVDFGVDGFGKEILTLTSPDESILCASRENQLLATYRITVRYLTDRPFTQRIKDCVQVVAQGISALIKAWGKPPAAPAPAAPTSAVPAAASNAKMRWGKTAEEVDTPHSKFRIGQAVVVTGALNAYEEFVQHTGTIKRIVKGHHFYFCVLLDCPEARLVVKDINSLRANKLRFQFLSPNSDEQELLCLKVGDIEKCKPKDTSAGAGGASLGKRKAEAEADKDGV
jgi:hypothetical protein